MSAVQARMEQADLEVHGREALRQRHQEDATAARVDLAHVEERLAVAAQTPRREDRVDVRVDGLLNRGAGFVVDS